MGPDHPPCVVAIDGVGDDAAACATLLTSEGHTVIAANAPDAPPADVLVVDCWTAESADVVTRHRAASRPVTSIAELLMTRTAAPTLGVTGSAGKTTVTRLAATMMRTAGLDVASSTTARAENAWPSAELLSALPGPAESAWLALELTSTHLAYMAVSPDVAVITTFWPDHIELHGSIGRYRAAKATIFEHQTPDGISVINIDDPGAASFTDEAQGTCWHASARLPVATGIGVEDGLVVVRMSGSRVVLCSADGLPTGPLASMIVTAACAALACGAAPEPVAAQMTAPLQIAHRRHTLATVGGVAIVDDSAATTPRKARAALDGLDPVHTVMIVGGALAVDGRPVHASPEEAAELQATLDLFATCRATVGFGEAGERLCTTTGSHTLAEALQRALAVALPGDTIVLSPMFPVSMPERAAFAAMARHLGGHSGRVTAT